MRSKVAVGSVTLVALVLLTIAGLRLFNSAPGRSASPPDIHPSSQSVSSSTRTIQHTFIIVEENKPIGSIIGNGQAPYINTLIKHSALAANYSAISHPSLPNYIALSGGSTQGVTSDCNPPASGCMLNAPNIADRLESVGKTWKAYAEGMPSPCYAENSGTYATKHEPFLYYTDILNNGTRCRNHIVPFSQLSADLISPDQTPDFAFITPNLCNDMHDCPVATGDAWLAKYVPQILGSKAFTTQPSLLFITWDEGDGSSNQIATIAAGSAVKAGYQSTIAYTHYSLVHTIESIWKLSPLTSDVSLAPVMDDILKK